MTGSPFRSWDGRAPLSLFPGGMNTSRIHPLAVDATELVYHFYFADVSPATAAARAATIAGNCAIVREDFAICEHTQRNYASGAYRPGPLSPRHSLTGASPFGLISTQSPKAFLARAVRFYGSAPYLASLVTPR